MREFYRYSGLECGITVKGGFVLASLIGLILSLTFLWQNREQYQRISPLQTKINPNVSSIGNLVRLPGIGLNRAMQIFDYRNRFMTEHEGGKAFEKPEDLNNIRGIGPKTVEAIAPFLEFE